MFHKILLPIDLNHQASWDKALPLARRCAGASGEIHVLGIVHDLGAAMVSSYLPEGFEQKAMERVKEDLVGFVETHFPPNANVQIHVGHGHVPETVLRIADELDADLIVMASHPPSDFQTLLVGSSADKVVRHATRPVLVVR